MNRRLAQLISLPNMLSLFRLVCVPVLIFYIYSGEGKLFLQLLFVSLLSDALDGYFARRLNMTTALGAKLDSLADAATYGVMFLSLWVLWPQQSTPQSPWLLGLFVAYLVPVAVTLRKFGVYPSYHTWGAKIVAILMVPVFYALTLYNIEWPFRALVAVFVLVSLEEVIITIVLKKPHNNVPTLYHLLTGRLDPDPKRRFSDQNPA